MEPYLVTKKEQARHALGFQEEKKVWRNRFSSPQEWEERCSYWIQEAKKLKV
jgi:sulfur transfer protein SufE